MTPQAGPSPIPWVYNSIACPTPSTAPSNASPTVSCRHPAHRPPKTAGSTPADILKELTPAAGEPVLPPLGPDKFIASDLDKMLKERGIKTVIAIGTQAHTSVLHTGAAAALRGYKVIVPVDGMSADDVFPELYTAWHLATAARISPQVTLTRFNLIGF